MNMRYRHYKKYMDTNSTIIVTGAAGFIGSCMVNYLNEKGFEKLILVDEFDEEEKELNLLHKKYLVRVEREDFFDWIQRENIKVDFVFHLGARTDTTEFDYSIHQKLNVEYSQKMWNYCTANQIPLVYASSAATYGNGDLGYDDSHEIVEKLQPLNRSRRGLNYLWAATGNSLAGRPACVMMVS